MASDPEGDEDQSFYDPNDLTEIHQGIVNDDLDLMRQALDAGVNMNEKFGGEVGEQHEGMTPLALAAALNKVEAVKLLLSRGADVNDTFAELKTTSLMTSSFHGHADIVRALLKKGADVRAVDLQFSTALGYAFGGTRSLDVIKQLLRAGVDVNKKNMLGMNALLLVAGYGDDRLVKMVVEAGADANSTNDFGHSALHLAVVGKRAQLKRVTNGHTGAYGLNRRSIDSALKDWARAHPDDARLAVGAQTDEALERVGRLMMEVGARLADPDTAAEDDQEAMNRRVEAVCRYRQEEEAKKKKAGGGGLGGLLSCAGKRSKKAKSVAGEAAPPLAGAPPAPLSAEQEKELGMCVERCTRALRIIIDGRCRLDTVEKTFGVTALDMAILLGDVESTVMLMGAGGDPSHLLKMFAMSDLYEAIMLADKKKVKELLARDVDIDVNEPLTHFNTTRRRADGVTESVMSDGLTPVAVAAQMPDPDAVEIVKMLVKQGANVNKVGLGGSSALAEASRLGNLKMVQSLVQQGADVEVANPEYKDATPLGVAVMNKHEPVVEFLIKKGAKVDKLMSDGGTALTKASESGDAPMVERLLGASLVENYAFPNAFMSQMAELYQKPDRDMASITKRIDDHIADQRKKAAASAAAAASRDVSERDVTVVMTTRPSVTAAPPAGAVRGAPKGAAEREYKGSAAPEGGREGKRSERRSSREPGQTEAPVLAKEGKGAANGRRPASREAAVLMAVPEKEKKPAQQQQAVQQSQPAQQQQPKQQQPKQQQQVKPKRPPTPEQQKESSEEDEEEEEEEDDQEETPPPVANKRPQLNKEQVQQQPKQQLQQRQLQPSGKPQQQQDRPAPRDAKPGNLPATVVNHQHATNTGKQQLVGNGVKQQSRQVVQPTEEEDEEDEEEDDDNEDEEEEEEVEEEPTPAPPVAKSRQQQQPVASKPQPQQQPSVARQQQQSAVARQQQQPAVDKQQPQSAVAKQQVQQPAVVNARAQPTVASNDRKQVVEQDEMSDEDEEEEEESEEEEEEESEGEIIPPTSQNKIGTQPLKLQPQPQPPSDNKQPQLSSNTQHANKINNPAVRPPESESSEEEEGEEESYESEENEEAQPPVHQPPPPATTMPLIAPSLKLTQMAPLRISRESLIPATNGAPRQPTISLTMPAKLVIDSPKRVGGSVASPSLIPADANPKDVQSARRVNDPPAVRVTSNSTNAGVPPASGKSINSGNDSGKITNSSVVRAAPAKSSPNVSTKAVTSQRGTAASTSSAESTPSRGAPPPLPATGPPVSSGEEGEGEETGGSGSEWDEEGEGSFEEEQRGVVRQPQQQAAQQRPQQQQQTVNQAVSQQFTTPQGGVGTKTMNVPTTRSIVTKSSMPINQHVNIAQVEDMDDDDSEAEEEDETEDDDDDNDDDEEYEAPRHNYAARQNQHVLQANGGTDI